MRWGALAGLLVATASLAACSSDAPTSRSSGSVAVSLASPTLTVSPGGQVSTTVTITRTTSAAGSVTLGADNLPVGVTATFAPSTLVGDAATSELTFAVPSSTPPGTSAVTIRAVGADSSAATVQLELAISTPEPSGYTLDVTPSVIPVPQRASGSATIIIQRTGNFASSPFPWGYLPEFSFRNTGAAG